MCSSSTAGASPRAFLTAASPFPRSAAPASPSRPTSSWSPSAGTSPMAASNRPSPKAPMSARPTNRPPSGFTLIELMVASAVGGVILVAALAAFDLQRQFSRNTEQLLGAQSTANLALTMMQRDLENAGYRFHGGPSDAGGYTYAAVVRPYDNLGTNILTLKNDPV